MSPNPMTNYSQELSSKFSWRMCGYSWTKWVWKTTLFQCVLVNKVLMMEKFFNNKSIEQLPIHLRSEAGLGYLPQQRSVFDMSVFHNVLGVAQISIKGAEQQRAVTEKLLDEFNLQHLRTLNASVLSGGEIRRVMLARLIINKPKVILLDNLTQL